MLKEKMFKVDYYSEKKFLLLEMNSAGVDGYVRFDGQVACSRGGDFACTPIECKELYEIIF